MFCKTCGSELPNDAKFCPKCGGLVISQEPTSRCEPETDPQDPVLNYATPPEAPVARPQYRTTDTPSVTENAVPRYNAQAPERRGSEPLKICCPECGSRNLQVLSETKFLIKSRNCMICKNCSEKFMTPKQIKEALSNLKSPAGPSLLISSIVTACSFLLMHLFSVDFSSVDLLFTITFAFGIYMSVLLVLLIINSFLYTRKKSNLEKEYSKTVDKMSRFQ